MKLLEYFGKMKPFNLEQARAGKPVCTRGGLNVRILFTTLNHPIFKIAAAITTPNKVEVVETFTTDGHQLPDGIDRDGDLMMVAEKKTGWIAIYHTSKSSLAAGCSHIYKTKEEAEYFCEGMDRFTTVQQIEWEE